MGKVVIASINPGDPDYAFEEFVVLENNSSEKICLDGWIIGNPKNILSIRKKKCLSLVVLLVISFIVWENQRAVQEHIGESLPTYQSNAI